MAGRGVDVSQSTKVQLLGPSFFSVETTKEEHQERCEPDLFFFRNGMAFQTSGKNGRRIFFTTRSGEAVVQSMIRKPATQRMKVIMAQAESVKKSVEVTDLSFCGLRKPLYPMRKIRLAHS